VNEDEETDVNGNEVTDVNIEETLHPAIVRNDDQMALRNVLFVVCCVGQYEFLCPDDQKEADLVQLIKEQGEEKRRNRALLLGLLLPLCDPQEPTPPGLSDLLRNSRMSELGNPQVIWESGNINNMIRLTKILLPLLAHHLHLLRRRGVYPLTISTIWFLIAFAVGVYQSFRQAGDCTTAHSLAVGLLLSWLPSAGLDVNCGS
jgi:hypothetical protein